MSSALASVAYFRLVRASAGFVKGTRLGMLNNFPRHYRLYEESLSHCSYAI